MEGKDRIQERLETELGDIEEKGLNQEGVKEIPKFVPVGNVPSKNGVLTIAVLDDNQFQLATTRAIINSINNAHRYDYTIQCKTYHINAQNDAPLREFQRDLRLGQLNGIISDHDMLPEWSGTTTIETVRSKADTNLHYLPILLNSAAREYDEDFVRNHNVIIAEKPVPARVFDKFVSRVVENDVKLQSQLEGDKAITLMTEPDEEADVNSLNNSFSDFKSSYQHLLSDDQEDEDLSYKGPQ